MQISSLLFYTLCVVTAFPADHCKKLIEVIKWVDASYGDVSKLSVMCGNDNSRKIVAAEDIAKGQAIAYIPASHVFSSHVNRFELPMFDPTLDATDITEKNINLLVEMDKGKYSFFNYYFKHLPDPSKSHPLWYSEEQMAPLKGTFFERHHNGERQAIVSHSKAYIQRKNLTSRLREFSDEELLIANFYTMSRSFGVHDGHAALIPIADATNHAFDFNMAVQNGLTDDFPNIAMMAVRDIKQGEEIYNTYGKQSNHALFRAYGFTLPDNHYDSIQVYLKKEHKISIQVSNMLLQRRHSTVIATLSETLRAFGDDFQNACSLGKLAADFQFQSIKMKDFEEVDKIANENVRRILSAELKLLQGLSSFYSEAISGKYNSLLSEIQKFKDSELVVFLDPMQVEEPEIIAKEALFLLKIKEGSYFAGGTEKKVEL